MTARVLSTDVLAEALDRGHDDPTFFVESILRVHLRDWQAAACERLAERVRHGDPRLRMLVRANRGSGKTRLAACLVLWFLATRFNAKGLTTSLTWDAVINQMWSEIRSLHARSLLGGLGVGRVTQTRLEFSPTWFAVGASADKDTPQHLEGLHGDAALRVIDEAARGVPSAIFESTEGMLTSPENFDLWISTPGAAAGNFYDRDLSDDPDVIRVVVTVDDLIRDKGISEVERQGFRDWKAHCLREWGPRSPSYLSQCMAAYVTDSSDNAVFPTAWAEAAMRHGWTVQP